MRKVAGNGVGSEERNVPLQAFLVDCDGENGAQLYFAETRGQAKASAANEEGTDITGVVSCKRAPQYDEHAPGPVPIEVLIKDGWWWECSGCSQRVEEDSEHWHEDAGDVDQPCDSQRVIVGQSVWCCQGCKDRDEARDRAEKARVAKLEADARAATLAKFPEVTVTHVIERYHRPDPLVTFHVPGSEATIQWEVGSAMVLVAPVDLPVWNAYEESRVRG